MNAIPSFELTELHRRLANIVRIGTVKETDPSGPVPKVRVKIGQLVTAWLPVLTQRAGNDQANWLLDENEQVMVLAPSGELGQGVVVGSLNQASRPATTHDPNLVRTTYQDGALMSYHKSSHELVIRLPNDGQLSLEAPGGLMITGDVWVTGDISASGDITDKTRSMADDRELFNAHIHKGVRAGGDVTQLPTPEQ